MSGAKEESRPCRICGREEACRTYEVREMHFGTRERFRYRHFASCGCLQLVDVPEDLGRYYPDEYYSFRHRDDEGLAGRLKAIRGRAVVSGAGLAGRLLAELFPPDVTGLHGLLREMDARSDWRILDVGCGNGEILDDFAAAGFTDLLGVDPYAPEDVDRPNGVRIRRGAMDQARGPFDLVMMHHSLEHMRDQRAALRTAARLLRPGGWCLVRTPVTDSWAWEHYREDWIQIDAPRHVVVHSTGSLERLAADAGLALHDVRRDSVGIQFFGSELYRRDVALAEGADQVGWWRKRRLHSRARRLNRRGRGDQAAFLFRPEKAASAVARSGSDTEARG